MGAGYHIENFGCRAARADGEAVSERLIAAGLTAAEPAIADVVVVNTCSVTEEADRAARSFIRRAHRRNPKARIVVTGCYAQRAPEELARMSGVAAVVGNSHKALAPGIAIRAAIDGISERIVPVSSLLDSAGAAPIWADDRFAHSFVEDAQVVPGTLTRPNLKIQEGCGNRCTFCVIPQTRGGSRSLEAEKVLQQVRGFVAAGGNELVLSGINLGRWGRDLPVSGSSKPMLARLVRRIFEETELPRLRLSSIEPMDWDAELIGVMRQFGGGRLARHAHLPLQSGSDAVLRRMHRRYRPWHYLEKVAALIEASGTDLTLGADVMAGFPGESEREFQESCEFIRKLPFGYLHLFPFSPRPGTPAWALHAAQPVPPEAVEERMAELRSIREQKMRAHRSRFVGRTIDCITLQTPDTLRGKGWSAALTENFLPLKIEGVMGPNQLLRVRVTGMCADGELLGVPEGAGSGPKT